MIGANAPAALASRPIRIVLCDEVDRYPASAGTEGDPVNLARKRTITYRSRKRIGLFSTPTIKGKSRIERAWKRSDQRRYYMPCPHCGHSHVFKWENISIIDDDPMTAKLSCPSCGGLIEDFHKPAMLEAGEWVKENPESRLPGFHINELYSPWRSFADVATDFYAAKGNPQEEKTWWNTSMGEPFEESGELADADELAKRRENYDADTLPSGALTVTFGADVQKDRIEIEFVAWGAGEESWGIEPIVLDGNPAEQEIRTQLEDDLAKIHEAVKTSNVNEVQERVMDAIVQAERNADKSFQQLEIANAQADEVVDPHVEKILRSRWTALITGAVVLGSFILGLIVGTNI